MRLLQEGVHADPSARWFHELEDFEDNLEGNFVVEAMRRGRSLTGLPVPWGMMGERRSGRNSRFLALPSASVPPKTEEALKLTPLNRTLDSLSETFVSFCHGAQR